MVPPPHERILALLAERSVPYREDEHEPVLTSADAARVRGISMDAGAKSLLIKTREGAFHLVVIPGSARLDLAKVAALVQAKKVHFASPTEVERVMGCAIGACYPLGSVCGLRPIVDPTLLAQSEIDFNPGSHTHSIAMKSADYAALEQPLVADVRAAILQES